MTRLLVLGVLNYQPMSGYDIQQLLKLSDAERWGGVLIGSIYHALNKMDSEGYVKVRSIEKTGHRQKAVYEITAKGREYLKDMVRESLETFSSGYPSTLYAGLAFIDKVPKQDALIALQTQANAVDGEIEALEAGLRAKTAAMQGPIPPMTQLIFDSMFDIARARQSFVQKAMLLLQDQ